MLTENDKLIIRVCQDRALNFRHYINTPIIERLRTQTDCRVIIGKYIAILSYEEVAPNEWLKHLSISANKGKAKKSEMLKLLEEFGISYANIVFSRIHKTKSKKVYHFWAPVP